jgi:amino acid adenylation domain-containing protein
MTRVPESVEERLKNLSSHRSRLLELMLNRQVNKSRKITPSRREKNTERYQAPTSWAQQRLWFIDQLEGARAPYFFSVALRLQGILDLPALRTSLDTIVRRHEVLRTVFVGVEGVPRQEIEAERTFDFQSIDLIALSYAERERQVEFQKIEEANGKFNLRTGPLIRGRLLRLQAQEHLLLINMHHIVSDGWSIAVFVGELSELYAGYLEGRPAALAPVVIQYADYAHWQHEWMRGDLLNEHLDYWRERLKGAAPRLELHTDRPRPVDQSFQGGNVRIALNRLTSKRLRAFAQSRQMTPFMILFAAVAILLSRFSNQEDILVGTPVANRQQPELAAMIGLFVNTLVLRVEVRGDMMIEEFLKQVKDVTLGAYAHQEVPFERLVEVLRPHRSLSRNPIFQVMLAFQNMTKTGLSLPELTVSSEAGVDETAMFDLMVSFEDADDEIVGSLNYSKDLFDRETVDRWATSLLILLDGILQHTLVKIDSLRIIGEQDALRILHDFNPKKDSYPQRKLIHELFEDQVKRNPHAIAVMYEGQSLTYTTLNCRANKLAQHLIEMGVGPDILVGICIERGPDIVACMLGILKAGGAYLPLDPAYPRERLDYMLRDALPQVVLVQARTNELLPNSPAKIVLLDTEWELIARRSARNPSTRARGVYLHNLAYVIYTSGSTGQPKGVMVEHRQVTRLFTATEQLFKFGERDVWTMFHSFAFDFSVWEVWGSLLYGGRLVVIPYLMTRSPSEFYRLLCDTGITVLNQTPSAFAQLVEAQSQAGSAQHSLRVVIFGGEALELRTLQPWVQMNGAEFPMLVNMYGITETTVHVTHRVLTKVEIESEQSSVVGRAISDLKIYLLDGYRRPVPIGMAGEIYVGGLGVSRGYLNRPDLTAERFLCDPFEAKLMARMYKSGDLGRWRADGTCEYLGRNDQQVKIRGYRIELGEIESQLARIEKVKEAIVVAREDAAFEKRLVAYIIPRDSNGLSVDELRTALKGTLPEYMIPSAFVLHEKWPLTPSGKLDRIALPAPSFDAYASAQFEVPEGAVEEALAQIWRQLLSVDRVGRQDNFFALGGHSLLATRVIAHIDHMLDVRLPLRVMFEEPTIQAQARWILMQIAAEMSSEDA